ncbi:helix-turn-helix transcriptional regulator [Paenibacillus sp. SI8]|uniref:helix-turn-helix transcriptional regulator n=1 Tax=unclassified Paenibacillus TaxID=185978 RepID=UPI0034665DDD
MQKSSKYKELGDFLRTRRMRLSPKEVGLHVESSRRRIDGLRREEVAALSGVSLAWYTYLEQGRSIRVSDQVLESLARTLKLDKDERTYLFQLAGQWLPDDSLPASSNEERISPALQLILDEFRHYPSYIIGRRWNIIAWNRLASELFGYTHETDDFERNLIWRMFTKSNYRQLFEGWENMAKGMLAQFRSFYGKYSDDPWYNELVNRLMETSSEFAAWWPRHDVFGIPEGYKSMNHPVAGELYMDYNSFILADDQNMIMTVFTPQPGTDTGDKLKRFYCD